MSVAVFGFLSFILLTRTLPKNPFGEWVLFITASNFIEMLRFGITRTAIVRFLSGLKDEERNKYIGSNWMIGLVTTLIIIVSLWAIYSVAKEPINESGFGLFFIWYPVLAVLNLPFNNAIALLEADQRFDKILIIRLINTGTFVFFLAVNMFFLHLGLIEILYAFLLINLLTSVITSIFKWDQVRHLFKGDRESRKTLLNFGKYTTGTLIGSNLLKSSDTVLLGLSPFLGTAGVAMYSVPLKLTEIIEIPLRSFLATAFPAMSKASMQGKFEEVKNIYYTYSGAITFLMIPILLVAFIFAEEFVIILGGRQYESTANVFRIFAVYGLFLPIDRFTGVALDSINRPKKNFFKVIWMTLSNIIGDTIAIFVLAKFFLIYAFFAMITSSSLAFDSIIEASNQYAAIRTLEMVSVVTILMTIVGMIVGFIYLNKELPIHYSNIFKSGYNFYKEFLVNYLRKNKITTI
ncbi:MAG: oligosaccharide flippase family protein [Bacteroidales bacterium]|nr:oligosaccharide flippase family protein [Bacteroidales bacterium]